MSCASCRCRVHRVVSCHSTKFNTSARLILNELVKELGSCDFLGSTRNLGVILGVPLHSVIFMYIVGTRILGHAEPFLLAAVPVTMSLYATDIENLRNVAIVFHPFFPDLQRRVAGHLCQPSRPENHSLTEDRVSHSQVCAYAYRHIPALR